MGDHAPPGRGLSGRAEADEAAAARFAVWLFAQPATFLAGAADLGALPPAGLPEIAFAGRSNVGKSSLVNALTGRRTLARTSSTPGRTRQLNFFSLADRLMLVDMPGYGYAAASKRDIAAWTALVRNYLKGRATLRRTCLLIDARHGLKTTDAPIMDMLDETAVSYQVVLTKADKVPAAARPRLLATVADALARRPAAHPETILTSAETGEGIDVLRGALAALAAQEQSR